MCIKIFRGGFVEFVKNFLKTHAYFLLGAACLVLVGIIYIFSGAKPKTSRDGEIIFHAGEIEITPIETATPSPAPAKIIIHIAGAVKNPGVFEFHEGARVNDALVSAGGENESADLSGVNLAEFLQDGMKIIIPQEGEEIDAVFVFANERGTSNGLININTASQNELQQLSGIGPVLAQNIIDFREAHGKFSSVDELIHVPRIGEATLERLRASITVGP